MLHQALSRLVVKDLGETAFRAERNCMRVGTALPLFTDRERSFHGLVTGDFTLIVTAFQAAAPSLSTPATRPPI
jgi:hypothetical protein